MDPSTRIGPLRHPDLGLEGVALPAPAARAGSQARTQDQIGDRAGGDHRGSSRGVPARTIHSDGWRGNNRVVATRKRYSYPRYQFSNRSDDIRALFIPSLRQARGQVAPVDQVSHLGGAKRLRRTSRPPLSVRSPRRGDDSRTAPNFDPDLGTSPAPSHNLDLFN
jgi:hypothetical protein